MDPVDLLVTSNAYFSLSIHTEKLLLMTFDDTPTGIQDILQTHTQTEDGWRTEGQTDVEEFMLK